MAERNTNSWEGLLYGVGLVCLFPGQFVLFAEPGAPGVWYFVAVFGGFTLCTGWAVCMTFRRAGPLLLTRAAVAAVVMALTTPGATRHAVHVIGGSENAIALAFHAATLAAIVLPLIGHWRFRGPIDREACRHCG